MTIAPERIKGLHAERIAALKVWVKNRAESISPDNMFYDKISWLVCQDLLSILDSHAALQAEVKSLAAECDELSRTESDISKMWKARVEKAKAELDATNKAWDIKQQQLEAALAELEVIKHGK